MSCLARLGWLAGLTPGLDPHREICFAEMGDRALTLLLSFGESIASSQKSPEKLFVLLDMYEAIRDTHACGEWGQGGRERCLVLVFTVL